MDYAHHMTLLLAPTGREYPYVAALEHAARRAATTKSHLPNGRGETIDYAALARAMHWMWRWIGEHWPRRQWLALPPARVAELQDRLYAAEHPAPACDQERAVVKDANAAERRAIVALWQRQLTPFSDRLARAAADRLLAESSFAPAPADLVKLCWRMAVAYYPTAGEAWGQIVHELRRGVPPWREPVLTIDLVESIVADWGWSLFVDAYTAPGGRDLSILQDRFGKEYDERVRRWNEGLRATGHEWDLADEMVMTPAPQPTAPAQPTAAPRVDPDIERQPDYPTNPGLDELRAYIRSRPQLQASYRRAADEADALWEARRVARARGDLAEADRLTRQITHGLTPAGIWDSVRQDYEALQPGITETLDAFWRKPTCPVCHGQQYVRVSFKAGRLPVVVEDHWREISRNSLGVTYHCPRCTTVAGRREVHAAIYEAIP